MCNLNVIFVLELISRDLYLLFAILLYSKFQNSIFYQHMRPKSGLKFPRPLHYLDRYCICDVNLDLKKNGTVFQCSRPLSANGLKLLKMKVI